MTPRQKKMRRFMKKKKMLIIIELATWVVDDDYEGVTNSTSTYCG